MRAKAPTESCAAPFKSSGIRPAFLPRAQYYGLERALIEAI